MKNYRSLSNKFILKLGVLFLITILVIGVLYITVTFFLLDKFYSQTTQRLNADVANHLIEEKFKADSPFLENGKVNKKLFDDIMHDMMAVNRAIEVYLLNENGEVLHSLVLDHSDEYEAIKKVNLVPIRKFIADNTIYVLGDDPKNTENKKIFSAASFSSRGKKGFIYILLASQSFEQICKSLFKGYFSKLTFITLFITMFLAIGIGGLSIFLISKSLLLIIYYVNRFKEGDLNSRIPEAEKSNLSILATTFNEMATTISQSIEEINSINTFKKELIANVSHDLRTPLTVIRGYAETLKDEVSEITDSDRKEFLNIIEKSTMSLSNLVNHLNDYSNLDAREIVPKKTVFNVVNLIKDIINRYEIIAKEKKIKIDVNYEKETLKQVYADKILIERVFQNVFDNALKFTPEHGSICFFVKSELKDTITIQIKDTGPGMKKEDINSVFKKYTKLSTSSSEDKGVGLGLAIVKKIMELHNTKAKFYCDYAKGCVFEFTLPIKDSSKN